MTTKLQCNSYLLLLQEMAGGSTANQREKARVKGKKEVVVC